MRFVLFYHSLVSDWNHGNAHFLRGVAADLVARGHRVRILEPADGWSVTQLRAEAGQGAIDAFQEAFPGLRSEFYDAATLDPDEVLRDADVVIAHEWNSVELLGKLTQHRARNAGYTLLFHDTHHRAVSEPDALARFPLEGFDGVLAFGASLRDQYERLGWGRRVWTWHEAADTRVFRPLESRDSEGDLVWIGNWGDDERAAELQEFLIEPIKQLQLRARVHGVRYPQRARATLAEAGIDYRGWIANYHVPAVFARFRLTVHVPRRPYVRMLPGIPTIRPFEALACGIPLLSTPWDDVEGLFRAGHDYVRVNTGAEMIAALADLMHDAAHRATLAANGLRTIAARHTCAHRVDELLAILASVAQRSVVATTTADAPRINHGPGCGTGKAPPPP